MATRPVMLVILDGFGWRDATADNAVRLARMPAQQARPRSLYERGEREVVRRRKPLQAARQCRIPRDVDAVSPAVRFARPTARRILLTLESRGFVRCDGRDFSLSPRVLSVGWAYLSSLNLWELAQRGITASMPLVEYRKNGPFFRQQDCTYDPETDSYRCPQGESLRHVKTDYSKGIDIYEVPERACAACPVRERCTDGMWARHVTRPFAEDMRERNRELQTTEAYKKAMRKRQVWVEPLFGEAKEWHQLRRFLLPWGRVGDSGLRPDPHGLRGLVNVNMQALLVATGQNLKRWMAATKRGQRPAGAQRAAGRLCMRWRSKPCLVRRPHRDFQRAGPFLIHECWTSYCGGHSRGSKPSDNCCGMTSTVRLKCGASYGQTG